MGLTAVILAAAGAHVVPETAVSSKGNWETAVSMHFYHALALLGLAALMRMGSSLFLSVTACCFAAGTVLFSGTLYLGAVSGPNLPPGTAPLGGLILMTGWTSLILYFGIALRTRNKEQ